MECLIRNNFIQAMLASITFTLLSSTFYPACSMEEETADKRGQKRGNPGREAIDINRKEKVPVMLSPLSPDVKERLKALVANSKVRIDELIALRSLIPKNEWAQRKIFFFQDLAYRFDLPLIIKNVDKVDIEHSLDPNLYIKGKQYYLWLKDKGKLRTEEILILGVLKLEQCAMANFKGYNDVYDSFITLIINRINADDGFYSHRFWKKLLSAPEKKLSLLIKFYDVLNLRLSEISTHSLLRDLKSWEGSEDRATCLNVGTYLNGLIQKRDPKIIDIPTLVSSLKKPKVMDSSLLSVSPISDSYEQVLPSFPMPPKLAGDQVKTITRIPSIADLCVIEKAQNPLVSPSRVEIPPVFSVPISAPFVEENLSKVVEGTHQMNGYKKYRILISRANFEHAKLWDKFKSYPHRAPTLKRISTSVANTQFRVVPKILLKLEPTDLQIEELKLTKMSRSVLYSLKSLPSKEETTASRQPPEATASPERREGKDSIPKPLKKRLVMSQ